MRLNTYILAIILAVFIENTSFAQHTASPHLLKDINTLLNSSEFEDGISFNNKIYFRGVDASHGDELWETDGTTVGTKMVIDINPGLEGSTPSYLVSMGNYFLFRAQTRQSGTELWRSDGTANGTYMVKEIGPGSLSSGVDVIYPLDTLAFFRSYDPTHGYELWVSNGTESGTRMAKDIHQGTSPSSFRNFYGFNGAMYFSGNDGVNGEELWKSDGTEVGTYMVREINPGGVSARPDHFIEYNGRLYFEADSAGVGREIWSTDGTAAGTRLLMDFYPGTQGFGLKYPVVYNNRLFFNSVNTTYGGELYSTDGTDTGTHVVKDIKPSSSSAPISEITLFNNKLYFESSDNTVGAELWVSDGTKSGTYNLVDINPGAAFSSPTKLTATPLGLFFFANDGVHGNELFITDGTALGTKRLSDINTQGNALFNYINQEFVYNNGKIVFFASDSSGRRDIYKSDGTQVGTAKLATTTTATSDSYPLLLWKDNQRMLYNAFTSVTGEELFVSDGTTLGTQLVKDINPGADNSSPYEMVELQGMLYFAASVIDDDPNILMVTDGTLNGTKQIYAMNGDSMPYDCHSLTICNGKVFFTGNTGNWGNQMWCSDGTAIGTKMISLPGANEFNANPTILGVWNNKLYYIANYIDTIGFELYVTDGSNLEAQLVKDIFPGSNGQINTYDMATLNNGFVFMALDATGNSEPWFSDGQPSGTIKLAEINTQGGSYAYGFKSFNNEVVFYAEDSAGQNRIYKTNGTPAGTKALTSDHVNSFGNIDLYPSDAALLYFGAETDSLGYELYATDGDSLWLVKELLPLNYDYSTSITDITTMNNRAYYVADDSIIGFELYSSNGTAQGTRLLCELEPGNASGANRIFCKFNHRIYLEGYQHDYGNEIFFIEPEMHLFSSADFYIQNGASFPSYVDSTFYGNVAVNSKLTRTFIIENVGVDTLQLAGYDKTGDANDFVMAPFTKNLLTDGDTMQIHLTFAPTSAISKNAVIKLKWNIGSESIQEYSFAVAGEGTPDLKVRAPKSFDFSVQPNPTAAEGIITAFIPQNGSSWIITDLNGRTVKQGRCHPGELQFQLPQSGLYLFTLLTTDGQSQTRKILVQ